MHRAEEIFTIQLARAGGKQANRFLYARGLQKADRDDVIQAALAWCWENRGNYSLTTTLETWFMNAVRDSYKSFRRAESPLAQESLENANLSVDDTTFNNAATESSIQALFSALTPQDKEIAALKMEGYSFNEICSKGYSRRAVSEAYRRIKQLHKLVPERVDVKFFSKVASTGTSDDADDTLSAIDVELERLEFAPPAGKDCPPCWRCMWFEGFMPAGKRDTRMEIADPEVREAVRATESAKIMIAKRVRG